MQCKGGGRSRPLPPPPTHSTNISQQRREVVSYRHYIVCQEMLRHVPLRLFDSYLTAYMFF